MGFFLLIPFFLVRFGLMALLDKAALKRAAYFAPLVGKEKRAYWIYQISNAGILICPLFLGVKAVPLWLFCLGAAVYVAGLILLIAAVVSFSAPSGSGIHQNGIYKLSRNPMYAAYFVIFMGCVLLTQSLALLVFLFAFQISAHWIILSEERWCLQKFGGEYRRYMEKVHRYI